MLRALDELWPTPDGVFTWGETEMPFNRGRRTDNKEEPKGPKLPLFASWDTERVGGAVVRANYKEFPAYKEGWPITERMSFEGGNGLERTGEYQSDPDAAYTGSGSIKNPYTTAWPNDAEDAEKIAWRAYQHDKSWRSEVLSSGSTLDDDRYIPDDSTDVDDIGEDDDEYVWINQVVHRNS